MKHRVICYECNRWVDFAVAGDLGQYCGDTFDCQCPEEETVIPKWINETTYGLFHPGSLEPPDMTLYLLRHPRPEEE